MSVQAVITADIVNSTRFSKSDEKSFRKKVELLLKSYSIEFYRGDSFQLLIPDPANALKIALAIRMEARKISVENDVRCGIGIGEAASRVPKLSSATYPAFVLSGRAFDRLADPEQRICIDTDKPALNPGLWAIGYFIDYLIRSSTERQAQVISELLKDFSQVEVARKLRKSSSTINKHAKAAGWNEIERLLKLYAQIISMIKNGNDLAD